MTRYVGAPAPWWAALLVVPLIASPSVGAQPSSGAFRSTYVVAVKDTAAHLLHVTATFRNVHQPYLDLALPAWTPGWYVIANYARNVERFTVTDDAGHRLHAPLVHAQTWRVDTRGTRTVVAQFDYLANVLGLNQAKLEGGYLFFTGTQLFLEAVGHRIGADTVRLELPHEWRIATALDATPDSATFTADNYDDLVDAPVEAGDIDVVPFTVEGKPLRLVFSPARQLPADSMRGYRDRLSRVIETEAAIFGGLPFRKYTIFFVDRPTDSPAVGSLEHHNSEVSLGTSDSTWRQYRWPSDWQTVSMAHEFFHLWNVKRIRPAGMWPYDYSRPNETPSLWFSEGVTDYYSMLASYRAGMDPADLARAVPCRIGCPGIEASFLRVLGAAIAGIDRNEAARYISPSDASVSTWLDYDTQRPTNFQVSYYNRGEVLGALLDLSILHDTHGTRQLDDVMRALYTDYYERGRGFTPEDLVHVMSTVAGRDYTEFFRRYVDGVDVPPYDTIFGYAGISAVRRESSVGRPGFAAQDAPQGKAVMAVGPSSPAQRAGIQVGDTILTADAMPLDSLTKWPFAEFPGWGGREVIFTVLRNGERRNVSIRLDAATVLTYTITPLPGATREQLAVRNAWLRQAPRVGAGASRR